MDAQKFRDRAARCRDLLRVAVRDDIREQLGKWADEFEAEADEMDRGANAADQKTAIE